MFEYLRENHWKSLYPAITAILNLLKVEPVMEVYQCRKAGWYNGGNAHIDMVISKVRTAL